MINDFYYNVLLGKLRNNFGDEARATNTSVLVDFVLCQSQSGQHLQPYCWIVCSFLLHQLSKGAAQGLLVFTFGVAAFVLPFTGPRFFLSTIGQAFRSCHF